MESRGRSLIVSQIRSAAAVLAAGVARLGGREVGTEGCGWDGMGGGGKLEKRLSNYLVVKALSDDGAAADTSLRA